MKKSAYLCTRRKQCVVVSEKSKAERLVAEHLDACGIIYRRQARFGSCFVDFYISSHCIGIEVDGKEHNADRDSKRDFYLLKRHRVRVLRVRNLNTEDILDAIENIKQSVNYRDFKGQSFDNYSPSPECPF